MTAGLEVHDLSVTYGSLKVVDSVSLALAPRRITGLVGPNGAGKTSLIEALCGFAPVSSGTVGFDGTILDGLSPHHRARLGLGRTFQSLELFEDLTVKENLAVAAGMRSAARGAPSGRWPAADLSAVMASRPADLTHAERSRVALARALAGHPRVLLLDEPAAGLDPDQRAALGRTLRELASEGLAILLVEHDLALVYDTCDDVYVLDNGRVVKQGTPDEVANDERVVALGLAVPPAASPLPDGAPTPSSSAGVGAPTPRPAVPPALRVEGLAVAYGRVPAVLDASLSVAAGEVVALTGANGAGKTTTLLAIAGALRPAGGRIRLLGAEVTGKPAHAVARRGLLLVPQDRPLFGTLTVAENLALAARRDGAGRGSRAAGTMVTAVVTRFPELKELLDRPASRLSGGERRLVALARAMATEPAVLLVDELTMGLAPAAGGRVRAMVAEVAAAGAAVLVVDQQPGTADGFASRTYVMDRGRIVGGG